MSIYIFGYGSIINMSYNKELDNPKTRLFYPVICSDMKRTWNVCGVVKRYLGVVNTKGFETNGILFKVSDEELLKLTYRETYYEPREISLDRLFFYNKPNIQFTSDDRIICFYSDPKWIVNNCSKKIFKEYLYICLEGCLKISKSFAKDFIEMTTF